MKIGSRRFFKGQLRKKHTITVILQGYVKLSWLILVRSSVVGDVLDMCVAGETGAHLYNVIILPLTLLVQI